MRTKTKRASSKGGRPAKFAEPSRPVTMTLPDRILSRLAEIDGDRAKAVVRAVDAVLGPPGAAGPVGELPVSPDESLLTVVRCPPLDSLPWLSTVEIAPGRRLLSLHDGIPVEKLEVALQDLLDSPGGGVSDADRRTLRTLLEHIRTPRRNQAVRAAQILVIQDRPRGLPSPRAPRKRLTGGSHLF